MGKLTATTRRGINLSTLPLACAAIFSTACVVNAQSADSFDTTILGTPPKPKPSDEKEAINPTPSRYAGEDATAFIALRAARFTIGRRTTDPFGHFTDPNVKPIIRKPVVADVPKPAAAPPVPFADLVREIAISAVMPSQRKFLVGTRSFTQHDKFPINFRNKNVRVEVTEVTSRQVTFRNLETGETASSVLDVLPEGMTKGQSSTPVPGMVASGSETPLQIGSGDSSNPSNP